MDDNTYIELLDKAYADLPEVLYKKERFEVPQVKGRLVKTRTIITNFKDISKHLSRDDQHMMRFMLKELGVRGELVDQRGELVLHSRFQPALLNKAVGNYFKGFVLCPHCNSPDTILMEDNSVLKCNACGHQERIQRI